MHFFLTSMIHFFFRTHNSLFVDTDVYAVADALRLLQGRMRTCNLECSIEHRTKEKICQSAVLTEREQSQE
jgi:hypothetical protein